ncbi:MAG: hypothetical protein PHU69_11045 [Fermentimonas sp.]|nr:hypothetical protein [Fermentimonas sp.]
MTSNPGDSSDNKEALIEMNRKWVEQKRAELQDNEEQIRRLQEEREGILSELEPMENWLDQVEGKDRQQLGRVNRITAGPIIEVVKEDAELRGDRLRDEVVKVLKEVYPETLYYREILRRLMIQGYQVGGKDPGLNLIAHITKDSRLQRGSKRGTYGLDEDYAVKQGVELSED